MKIILIIVKCIMITFLSLGQGNKEYNLNLLEKISSEKDAEILISNDSIYKDHLFYLRENKDTCEFCKYLFSKEKGQFEVFESDEHVDDFIIKILEKDSILNYRVRYIFLDNSIFSQNKIDSLRKIILKRIKKGEQFSDLAKEYSMDGNRENGGDLGWFEEGQMIDIFEKEVKKHNVGDIYLVDIPKKKWFYVVQNTHKPILSCKMTVITLKITE